MLYRWIRRQICLKYMKINIKYLLYLLTIDYFIQEFLCLLIRRQFFAKEYNRDASVSLLGRVETKRMMKYILASPRKSACCHRRFCALPWPFWPVSVFGSMRENARKFVGVAAFLAVCSYMVSGS